MYELIQAGKQSYYLDCPSKIGFYLEEPDKVTLIDSGNDKDAGKKALKTCLDQGWHVTRILNTHSNADHIGGNQVVTARTGCKAFAPGLESAFASYPYLESAFLFGGYPMKPLRNKFLTAPPCECEPLTEDCLPKGLTSLALPGHFFDMVGFCADDGVVFLADCLASEQTLDKYPFSFLYDVKSYLETLDMVADLSASLFVPSHAPAVEDIRPLAQINRDKVLENIDWILRLCRTPMVQEELLKQIFDHFSLSLDFNQYVLVGSTLRSYLAFLYDEGRIKAEFVDNRLLWSI